MPFQQSEKRSQGGDPKPSVETFIHRCLGWQTGLEEVTPLKGDASDRTYYRVRLAAAGEDGLNSLVVMRLSRPWVDQGLPFANICRYLSLLELGVPRIYACHEEWGMLALEDCGDLTLQEAYRNGPPERLKGLYLSALDDLITMQLRGAPEQRAACHAYSYAFDEERFVWELNFTVEHWIRRLLNKVVSPEDDRIFQGIFHEISRTMLDQKLYFTHRDYHSRNLMVQGNRLRILDFQDARLGPPQYDLASLLRDSYVQLPEGWEEQLLEYYLGRREKKEGATQDKEEFVRVFNVASLQRNLKAIGTFASQQTVRGNDSYLQYIPTTLSHIRKNLLQHEEFSPLADALARYIPSL